MTIVTNIRHFLDETGKLPKLPAEAKELVKFLADIIESATIAYDRPATLADAKCRKCIKGKPCNGEIEVWVYADTNETGWECLDCAEEGIIAHWEGTPWDLRDYTRH